MVEQCYAKKLLSIVAFACTFVTIMSFSRRGGIFTVFFRLSNQLNSAQNAFCPWSRVVSLRPKFMKYLFFALVTILDALFPTAFTAFQSSCLSPLLTHLAYTLCLRLTAAFNSCVIHGGFISEHFTTLLGIYVDIMD